MNTVRAFLNRSMLHGLGSRRARALNQTPSNSNELEKENTSRSHLASQRRNAKTQVSKVAANVEKGAAKRSLQGKPPGKPPGTTALKSKSKSNVTTFPVSGGRDNASKRAISEHDAVPPEKKPKTCRISLAPDCELRVSARSSIKRNAENKQKLTRELFKPISTLLGEKVDVSTSPNNRLELRTRSATVKSQQKKRSRLSISQNATPKGPHNKTSALRLSPLPSEILHLPLEHCSPSKEKSPSEGQSFCIDFVSPFWPLALHFTQVTPGI